MITISLIDKNNYLLTFYETVIQKFEIRTSNLELKQLEPKYILENEQYANGLYHCLSRKKSINQTLIKIPIRT